MYVCCECCVLSGRGLCDGLITRSEESYGLWCVVVCDLETSSRMRRPWPALGCSAIGGKKQSFCIIIKDACRVYQGGVMCKYRENKDCKVLIGAIPLCYPL